MPLHIALLGQRSITDAATGAVQTRSSRTIALVAYLAVQSEVPHPRARIAGLFWPESSEAQALTNLRREVHTLRRLLPPQAPFLITATDLRWQDSDDVQVDVRVFDSRRTAALAAAQAGDPEATLAHAQAALASYRGELLPGLYDDWVLQARAHLQQQCVDLCATVCQVRLRAGDPAGAIDPARRRIQLEPLEETGYRVLMEIQAELGDRAGAVSTYHRCASLLERELGVTPSQATRACLQEVMGRQHERTLALPASWASRRTGAGVTGLVGRTAEIGLLRDLWREVAAGRARLAVVSGDPGVGKTRLVSHFADDARRQGAAVATTQCFGTSGRLALAPLADWLRSDVVRAAGTALDAGWRAEVERLVPDGEARGAPAPTARAMVDAWQRHRFFTGVARALLAPARPSVFVLDNLQWCDQETLAFLTFFLSMSATMPVLVLATLRSSEIDREGEVTDWLVRMRTARLVTELPLNPLDVRDTIRLAEAMGGRTFPEQERQLLHAATGGFPLHIVEAMRSVPQLGEGTLPAADLAVVLRSRLRQTSARAQDVASLAAAVGRDVSLDLLAAASELSADMVVEAVDELWRRRILRESGEGYDFSHDLLRESAYAQLTPARQWLAHRRLAQAMEDLYADDLDPVCVQLAEQYARGGRPERAVRYYRRAAELAAGIFAHGEAVRLLAEARALLRDQPRSRDSMLRELELLEATAAPLNASLGYASAQLQSVLEESLGLAESLGRGESVVKALIGLWGSRFVQGQTRASHAAAARALSLVEGESELCGAAHFAVAGSLVTLGRPAESLPHFELAARLATGTLLTIGTRPDVHAQAFAAHAYWLLGRDDEASGRAARAIEIARANGHPYSLALALAYAAVTRQLRGDQAAAPPLVAELSELCERYGFGYYREWALVLQGWLVGGPEGVTLARRGIDNLRSGGSLVRMPYWLSLLADAQVRQGRPEEARATLDAAIVRAQAVAETWWLPELYRLRAGLDDDPQRAAARLRAALAMAVGQGNVALVRRCQDDLKPSRRRTAGPNGGRTQRP